MFKTIAVVLSANSAQFVGEMRQAGGALDDFSRRGDQVAVKAESIRKGLDTVGKAGVAIGVALAAGFAASVAAAASFDREMRNVATISASTRANFEKTSDALIDLSRSLPQSAKVLAQGLYDVASSGFDGAEAMSVLKSSAMAASAGLTTTAVAAKGITAVLNAYGKSGFEAAEVSDILFQTVNLGVVTFEELASSLGDFVGTASQLGVPIDEAASALAAMTLSGLSAAEASTSLNRVMVALIDPSDEMAGLLKEQGYESGVAAVQALGLRGVMELLRTTTGGNIETLQKLFPEMRGMRGALALMANEGANYARVAQGITSEQERMGATQRAFNEQSKSFTYQLEVAKNNLTAMGIEIGRIVLPALSQLTQMLGGVLAGFGAMPSGMQTAIVGLGAVVAAIAGLGGALVLLAPRLQAVHSLWIALAESSPALAAGLRTVALSAGVVGLALAGLAFYYSVVGASSREFEKMVADITEGLLAEARGLEGAADAAVKAQLVQAGLVGQAAQLGISYQTLAGAVEGNADALRRVGVEAGTVHGSLQSTIGSLGTLTAGTVKASDSTNEFQSQVIRIRDAFAQASQRVKEQEENTAQLVAVTGKSKQELVDMGVVTETTGDKIAKVADTIGLSSKALSKMGVDSEEAAKAFVKNIQTVMDATQKAFLKDFDVVTKFSASGWDKMKKDAEASVDAISRAEDDLASARQSAADLQERLNAKTKLSVSDNQQLAKANDKVTEATAKLTEAQQKGSISLGTLTQEISKFYRTSVTEAEAFTSGISVAIQKGLDPGLVARLLQQGPAESAPIIQAIVSENGSTLVKLMNEGEAALAKSSTLAVETARLTQLAVTSKSGQMVQELKSAMRIAQLEAESGGRLTINALAMSMSMKYGDVKKIIDDFGILVPADLGAAGAAGAAAFKTGLEGIAPSSDALVRAVDKNMRDFIGPLPPYMQERAAQIAAQWRVGIDPLPGDTKAVMYLLDFNLRGVLAALPGFTDQTVGKIEAFWRTGLDPMPGDTRARAEGTAAMLHDALDPLPAHSRETAIATVSAWLSELAKGTNGTSEQTAGWARALLGILNPILAGVGADQIHTTPTGETYSQGDGGRFLAATGGTVPGQGNTDSVPAMLTPGEFVTRKTVVAQQGVDAFTALNAGRADIVPRFALGGPVLKFAGGGSVPEPPDLSAYGTMVGYTGTEADRYTYDKTVAYIDEQERKKAAAAAAGGGAPYTGGDIGSGWQQITGYLDSKGIAYIVTSTTGGGHVEGSLHYQGKAVDMVGSGNSSMMDIFKTLAAGNPVPGINELFFDPAGYYYDEGMRHDGAIGDHEDHVHAATFDQGGVIYPGWNRVFNGTGKMEPLAPAYPSHAVMTPFGPSPVSPDIAGMVSDIVRGVLDQVQINVPVYLDGEKITKTVMEGMDRRRGARR